MAWESAIPQAATIHMRPEKRRFGKTWLSLEKTNFFGRKRVQGRKERAARRKGLKNSKPTSRKNAMGSQKRSKSEGKTERLEEQSIEWNDNSLPPNHHERG